ncbi:helix-turn-helix domain-containing protein [Bradyrhizobium uaiense]|uniref:Helix-turn-helix domain-containing protein n=1 Tax=Bradyrhizobium uaiense TaxID=2594946 RepID=A0A6P1B983_9BRAD|nr:helix-turn-helix domain-containing protein [Bradyrhizobium uaiense]NEU94834.1 helix-turn-helix domain-containing protein [Bradyrhizobium uaiense]
MSRKRCKIGEAADILGESERTIRNQAAAGKIPGAAKIFGNWSFDIALLHAFVAEKEREAPQGAVKRSGARNTAVQLGAPKPGISPGYANALKKLRLLAAKGRDDPQ